MKLTILPILFILSLSLNVKAGLSTSLMLFNEWDFQTCPQQAQKVVALNLKKINLVPTLHFLAKSESEMSGYCLHTTDHKCTIFNQSVLKKINQYWSSCLPVLVNNNIKLMITPHLDDGGGKGIWRNRLLFDPLIKYTNQLSYYDIMIEPIINIIEKMSKQDIEIEISMQGEMGATIFYAPESYIKMLGKIKSRLPNARVGISMNYNYINGDYNSLTVGSVQDLVNTSDFVGLSVYTPIKLKNRLTAKNHFRKAVLSYIEQWDNLGINIPISKPIVFSEVGIGGGNWKNDGKTVGLNIEEVAGAPYAGLFKHGQNPWKQKELFDFRRDFYIKLNHYLKKQFWQFRYKVIDAYIWNANTWDVVGLYPRTAPYKDDYILEKLILKKP